MTRTTAPVELVGRDDEVAAVNTFLDSLQEGPAGLVLEGEAGIGKTTVWRVAVEEARSREYGVLLARPSESEASLSFLGLGDLLGGVPEDVLDVLPEPQREALEAALLRTRGDGRGDRVALARGALNVLRKLAAVRPIVVAIDDVQWLDAPSADALRFLFRRLTDERVGLLASQRGEDAPPLEIDRAIPAERLRRAALRPLTFTDLVDVVRAHRVVAFTRPAWRAIHRTSGGNPLFALQLGDAVAARGGVTPGEELALPETLSAALRERLAPLSAVGRRALLDVSMLAQPTLALVEAQEGVDEALEAHVVELDGDRLRFTHPLLASVVQADVSPPERREAHRRLAGIVGDLEERALHLGRGTEEPDEQVAATLEQAADRAKRRGLPETAAELAEHAERLTPPVGVEEAARRATAAARYWNAAGDAVRSLSILRRQVETLPRGRPRARALSFLGFLSDDVQASERALDEAEGDPQLLGLIHADLSITELYRGNADRSATHARAAVEFAEKAHDPDTLAQALTGLALSEAYGSGEGALALLDRAAELERSLPEPLPISNSPTTMRGFVLLRLDRLGEAREALEEAYQRGLALGHTWRSVVLTYLAELEVRAGNWARALAHAIEAEELGRQWGHPSGEAWTLYGRAVVEAHLGNVEAARAAGVRSGELARETRNLFVIARAESALGFLDLSLGDFEAALDRLAPLVGLPGRTPLRAFPGSRPAADAVEALLCLGRVREAEELVERIERRAVASGLPSRLAAAARCRALVLAERGDLAGARAAIEDALAEHGRLDEPFELGRTLLAQGTIERRAKQKAAAREALERARAIFEELGARLWLDTARVEVERTGLRRASGDELTPTERQVAELAAGGATNKEIAGALFMSVKTVEANLSRVYRKLDVRSRTELASDISRKVAEKSSH